MSPDIRIAATRRATHIGVLVALLLALWLHVLLVLVSALAIYSVYGHLLQRLSRHVSARAAGAAALAINLAGFAVLGLCVVEAVHAFWTPPGLPSLFDLLADTLDRLRTTLPRWLAERLPASADDLRTVAAQWLRSNAQDLQRWGQQALRNTAHLFVGVIIGLLAAFERGPRLQALWMLEVAQSWRTLALAFTQIVSAQLRIAAANAALTALFLLVALPLAAGVHVPLAWTLVAFTFVAGLVPIVGNLASNGAIVLIALTLSPAIALAAVVFLLAIHKLEYFLNAHFVGERTNVPAPVLLVSMVVLEAAFGLAGLIAAPIYCAWVFHQFGGSQAQQEVLTAETEK